MSDGRNIVARYYPEIFDAADLKRAKEIILTDEGPGADSETRWSLETPYVMEVMDQALGLNADMVVLDYGCGVGRLAKAMIEAKGCAVIGLDISARMRDLARDYVASDRFITMSPGQFDLMVGAGLRVDAVIAVWVLQHSFAPAADIARIGRGLAAHGGGFVLNMPKRAVPAVIQGESPNGAFTWAHDGVDVAALLRAEFHVAAEGEPDKARAPNMADAGAYWLSLRHRTGDRAGLFSVLTAP